MIDAVFNMISHEIDSKYEDFMSFISKKQNIVLYGAGGIGNMTYNILAEKGCKVCYFIDDDESKWGGNINGIEIIPLKEIKKQDEFIIIVCVPCPEYVYKKLIDEKFKNVYNFPIMMASGGFYNTSLLLEERDKIYKVYDLLADDISRKVFTSILKHRITMNFSYFNNIISEKQYFPRDLFTLNNNECFVDGGSYDGRTTVDFVSEVNSKYNFIYAFEPDEKNFIMVSNRFSNVDNTRVQLYNAGLYSRTGSIGFCNNGNSSSFISTKGECSIQVIKLDDIVKTHKPTFIKLDIEGAEQEAICGMKSTILNYNPKLAISIYHKPNDLWELPLLIHDINSSYKLYIRHYLNCLNETVCYAL